MNGNKWVYKRVVQFKNKNAVHGKLLIYRFNPLVSNQTYWNQIKSICPTPL